ncbi:MAG: Rne/Rng family ribonuclease [Planctomycetes bacterium]|nr:Rne/Rng family ribonuclease [Planctomycetota bacterium]
MSTTQMLINYVPGEECRVALVEDGRLEELHAESSAAASRVGNIYLGVVANVESAIQAAFVDFGVEQHGFLHVTDLHPRYFPGEDVETTERVGHKTPRRERPLLQKCLKKGQEVVVQVLKEGVGTKGPSLTSYVSIPGRHLVMMPQMDRVGVSRKVEDEQIRRKMREVLDQLDLPEGFGFIIRTAGLDRTKAELKRDLAYLQRLWKDMEARRSEGSGPRLLYTESDLLVRALRDLTTTECTEIVIDNEQALARAAKFRKIVAPRSQTKLLHYQGQTPIFHAYGVEEQIINIHSREVPLPSGGRLVIDQTEALVAIDVNSGKSRSARDAETNAYKTNLEAVDEICRQLKLRDLGGVIIHDLIDMRDGKHRREIEARFRERLRRDRAKNTILPISNFGILEMTRQRIRSSHEALHFTDCPTCRGRGLVQRAESVAADALRALAALLDQPRVARIELVVSPRVAGEMLSNRRHNITRLEKIANKHVDVRVSETLPTDRVGFYAYDSNGADIEIDSLPKSAKKVNAEPWQGDTSEQWVIDASEEAAAIEHDEDESASDGFAAADDDAESAAPAKKKRKRRRRRGRRSSDKRDTDESASDAPADQPDTAAEARTEAAPEPMDDTGGPRGEHDDDDAPSVARKKRSRRRGRRKKKSGTGDSQPVADAIQSATTPDVAGDGTPNAAPARKKSRRRKKKTTRREGDSETANQSPQPVASDKPETPDAAGDETPPRKRRSRSRRTKKAAAPEAEPGSATADGTSGQAKPKPLRTLYASRRKLTASERARHAQED